MGSAAHIDDCPGRQDAIILDVHKCRDAVGTHIAAVKILPGSQVRRRQESIRRTCKSDCRFITCELHAVFETTDVLFGNNHWQEDVPGLLQQGFVCKQGLVVWLTIGED